MIEVEAKIRISDVKSVRKRVKRFGKYIGRERKIDDYYTLEDLKSYPKKSLRIRKKGKIFEINFKQRISYVKGVHAKNESEFIIRDVRPFLDLINDFGFKKWLRKKKLSEIYEISANFHIEINHVKSLGWFIEIEYLCDKSEIVNARKKVLDIAKKLGISDREIIKEGYTKMLWDKR